MKTLPYDISRCAGRMDLLPDGQWCEQRDTCQRYLAFTQWDRAAGIESYRGISVVMAVRECQSKIEVKNEQGIGGSGAAAVPVLRRRSATRSAHNTEPLE